MDKITLEARSKNMSRIRAKNTTPELTVRKLLFKKGYRYKIHYKLPGKPDIVFPSKKLAIFIHGCFWHGHGCSVDHPPKSNSEFWRNKVENNKSRDEKVLYQLISDGWKVITIWECSVRRRAEDLLSEIEAGLSRAS